MRVAVIVIVLLLYYSLALLRLARPAHFLQSLEHWQAGTGWLDMGHAAQ